MRASSKKKVASKSVSSSTTTPEEVSMPQTIPKKSKKVAPSVLPIGASTSTTAAVRETSAGLGAPGATALSSAVVSASLHAPPDLVIPSVPPNFTPVSLGLYKGAHVKGMQLAAIPNAIAEIQASASAYATTFGPAAPPADDIATNLTDASAWTAMRVKIEALLVFAKSGEAVAWKTGLANIEQLSAIYKVLANVNPALVAGFPAIGALVDVDKVLGQAAAQARARNAKARAAKAATPAATATAGASPGGTGGAGH
jgi:hypothetical protein